MYAELVVEDVEEFAFYAANVTLAKDASTECPMDVLESRVIAVLFTRGKVRSATSVQKIIEGRRGGTHLVSKDECTQEDTFAGPLLEGDLKMWLCAVDVHECYEEDW